MKRSGKFYRKNEKEVMKFLGLKATYNSGSGWIEKEDGQNEFVICQLKSTDAQSIKINQKDIRTLEHNACVSHKIPVFAIQFLNTGEVWLMAKPADLPQISDYLYTGKIETYPLIPEPVDLVCHLNEKEIDYAIANKVKSSSKAREEYKKEQMKKYDKTKYAK